MTQQRNSSAERRHLGSFARETARGAGVILRRGYHRPRSVRKKGKIDLVTSVDLSAEKYILKRILAKYPGHQILAEESGAHQADSAYRWVVDPLDGTVNFAHGYPGFCVSIALQHYGETLLGVVYEPLRDELFFAAKGAGARLNNKAIKITRTRKLENALCATGFPYDKHTSSRDNLANFNRMMKKVQDIRRGGSAALDLCYLACGRLDAFWELKLSPWDTAAGALIAAEAGARVTDFSGNTHKIELREILATNSVLHKQMLSLLR